ncbi:MAG: hypothetical protein LLG13_07280 [Bacteroidales bacterium]|nr:hypothetical protein [Bacteroidales bacterium]
MNKKKEYKLVFQKWLWVPIVLMGIAFIPWVLLVVAFSTRYQSLGIIALFLLILNSIILVCSFVFVSKVVHSICGIIMIIIVIVYFTYYHEFFQSSLFVIDYMPIILNLFAGLFLIILPFIRINSSQSGKLDKQ